MQIGQMLAEFFKEKKHVTLVVLVIFQKLMFGHPLKGFGEPISNLRFLWVPGKLQILCVD